MENDNEKRIEELSVCLNRAVELLAEIKGNSPRNHKWVKKPSYNPGSYNRGDQDWWHCENCLVTPTTVKPGRVNEDMPLKSPCPGPVLYPENQP